MATLSKIEGIGPVCGTKMGDVGIKTTGALLEAAAAPAGRKALATKTGFTPKQILGWANRADLMRVKGVGEEFSDLLELSGVDTVKALAKRKPENLHAKLAEVNAAKNAVRRAPNLSEVEGWVAHAKTLPRVLSY